MREPKPVYGMGFFHVRESGWFDEVVVFDYYDPDLYYFRLEPDRLEDEKGMLADNMQFYLDLEEVKVNGKPSFPKVIDVDIGFRGSSDRPYIVFTIVFEGDLVKGVNIFEDTYDEETVDYGYKVYWILSPSGRFIEADLGVPYTVGSGGRILSFKVEPGTRIRGYERIVFELEKNY